MLCSLWKFNGYHLKLVHAELIALTDRDEIDLREESGADGNQSLLWPFMEPVNVGAVHNGRELAGTHPECGTHGGEAQYHLVEKTGSMYLRM